MSKQNKSNVRRSQVVKYWANKYLSKNLEVIDYSEEGAIPIIEDLKMPCCWACGCKNYKIYENKEYYPKLLKEQYKNLWDLSESSFLQKAHIVPRQFQEKDVPSNLFLLCKQCHNESPDYIDTKYFFAYIRYMREHVLEVQDRRDKELKRAIYELSFKLNKNILSLENIFIDDLPFNKAGIHVTTFSLYTMAATIVDCMDELDIKKLSSKDIEKIKNEYIKYGLEWDSEYNFK